MGRRPRALWVALPGLMVGGGRPHTRCPQLVLQVPYQVGQRSMPRCFRVPPCSVGRHAVLLAGWMRLIRSMSTTASRINMASNGDLPTTLWAV